MRNLILLTMGLMTIFSCKKLSDTPAPQPQGPLVLNIPPNDTLDVNGDSIADFAYGYKEFATPDVPSSEGSLTAMMIPLNQNQFLYQSPNGVLFMSVGDTIRQTANTKSDWISTKAELMVIYRTNNTWDNNWNVISKKTKPFYLAYKMKVENTDRIGWLKIELNTTDGKLKIVDKGYTEDSELIIKDTVVK